MSDPAPTAALSVPDAALSLGIRTGTLRRWLREGCPTVRAGRRGRGGAVLVDPEQVRRWREASGREQLILELAAALPELLAQAAADAWQQTEQIDKRRQAGIAAASWYIMTAAALDYLRGQCPAVPDVRSLPAPIERLRQIARE